MEEETTAIKVTSTAIMKIKKITALAVNLQKLKKNTICKSQKKVVTGCDGNTYLLLFFLSLPIKKEINKLCIAIDKRGNKSNEQ